jgi:hypothetical protein
MVLFLWVGMRGGTGMTGGASATYNSVALSSICNNNVLDGSIRFYTGWFLLKTPSTGSNTISITVDGSATSYYFLARSYSGVLLANPVFSYTQQSSTQYSTTPGVSVSSNADHIVLDGFVATSDVAYPWTANQTLIAQNGTTVKYGTSYAAGAFPSVSMTWSKADAIYPSFHNGISIQPASVGGGAVISPFMRF